MFSLIQKGGPAMYPIILASVLALAIILERLYHLYRAQIDTKKFMEEVTSTVRKNKIAEAVAMCDETPGPIAHMLKAGILKHSAPREEMKEAIEDAAMHEIPRLEKNLSGLATIAQISPLLGLLGTVIGMVKCFQVVQEKSAGLQPVNPADLAGGIWQALIATVAGLIVAIPVLVAYNYLTARVNHFVWEMELSASELIDSLSQKNR
jgi:biopolymer transport protein ExbB